jgi:UDPglucose 6-dehydrogenase/GDP-mannose 6-dehydrogenase
MRVSIIGTGYVGLVTGVCLAEKGHSVSCVDVDRRRVDLVNHGEVPFHEPGLAGLLARNVRRERFRATVDLRTALLHSDLTMVAVGTPTRGRTIDLRDVRRAAAEAGRALRDKGKYHVVAVKSTVVPGTTEAVILPILETASGKKAGRDFGLGVNPEFLSEGEAVRDGLSPDRIVLGGLDRRSLDVLARLYRPFGKVPVLRTNLRTAEAIKYTSNALLALLISFSNEIADYCETVGGIDCEDVMDGVHLSHYLTPSATRGTRVRAPIAAFLRAGCGFGGSCLPKDVSALEAQGRAAGARMGLLGQVLRINTRRPERMLAHLRRHFPRLDHVRVSVLGLAFKPGTDDLRESPAIPIVERLLAAGAEVTVYDPVAMPAAKQAGMLDGARYATTLAGALDDAQAVLVVTAWPEFRRLERLPTERRRALVVVDGRRLLDKHRFDRYEGIGLSASQSSPGRSR